jgi:hypothetical protein
MAILRAAAFWLYAFVLCSGAVTLFVIEAEDLIKLLRS